MDSKTLDRFWNKVDLWFGITDEDCWNWIAGCKTDGYGWFSTKRGNKSAHRLLFEHFKGKILDKKMQVMHKCNNPKCVNPSHMELGTNKQNQLFATKCGRSRRQKRPKLTEQECQQVIEKYNSRFNIRLLAKQFSISTALIYDIVQKKGAYA